MTNIDEVLNNISHGDVGIITASELKDKLIQEEDLYLLDIRRKADFDEGHIKSASHTEWFEIRDLLEADILPKDKTIITICYSGQSSMQVATILNVSGYKALSLLDGMNEWTGEQVK